MARPVLHVLAALALWAVAPPVAAEGLTQTWRLDGLALPESVAWDAAAGRYYVSIMGKDPMAKDGDGAIGVIGADGALVNAAWVAGLDAPKGIDVSGTRLFTADIDTLVEIDIVTGAVANRYTADGAKLLNDVVVAPDGRVFVSDTFGNAIYVLANGALTLWLQDMRLAGANGLTVMGSDLVVANLGDVSEGFDKIKPGHVVKVDMASKAVTDFGSPDASGVLDGIEPDGTGGVVFTDNGSGRILQQAPGGSATEIGMTAPSAADLEYVPDQNLLVIPLTMEGAVVAMIWAR